MNKSCKDRLFIDLGANKGQSILLYSKLFPEYNNLTDVITIEPTNDPKILKELEFNISTLSREFKSINFINAAVSTSNKPLIFFDGLDEASTSLLDKVRLIGWYKLYFRKLKSLIKFFIQSKNKLHYDKSIYFRRRLVNTVDILELLSNNSSNQFVDLKLDVEGSEYDLINYVYKNYAKKINSLYIEIHGLKAGFTHINDINLLSKARKISHNVYSWDAVSDDISNIRTFYLSDLVKQRTNHIKRYIFNNKLKYFYYFIYDKLISLPLIRNSFHSRKYQAHERLYISNQLSHSTVRYCLHNTPERILIRNNPSINIKDNKTSLNCYNRLCDTLNNHFSDQSNQQLDVYYKIALSNSSRLLHSNQSSILNSEIYRFIVNPLVAFPEIIDLLVSPCFRNLFSTDHESLRIAGINLRYSSPSSAETHTTAFHRDYNSYYTVKLFIPLTEVVSPFLEYIPATELVSTGDVHFAPRHFKEKQLPTYIQRLRKAYSSTDISSLRFIPSTCIHREKPSSESKITLIVTYLSHPDNGYQLVKSRRSDMQKYLKDSWAEDHLSFLELI
tara:strand:- start:507 stop:2183 length:1677 start_codon:yes stop_codon:yes gene_type:complete